jgi:hypothetical protein
MLMALTAWCKYFIWRRIFKSREFSIYWDDF